MQISQYFRVAHWVVFCAGLFVVSSGILNLLQIWIQLQALGQVLGNASFHDTYYVPASISPVVSIGAVLVVTVVLCWGLRRMAYWLEEQETD